MYAVVDFDKLLKEVEAICCQYVVIALLIGTATYGM